MNSPLSAQAKSCDGVTARVKKPIPFSPDRTNSKARAASCSYASIAFSSSPTARSSTMRRDIQRLYNIIEVDTEMKSFDQYAVELYEREMVTREEAISACSDEEAFTRVTSGIKSSEGRKLLG